MAGFFGVIIALGCSVHCSVSKHMLYFTEVTFSQKGFLFGAL